MSPTSRKATIMGLGLFGGGAAVARYLHRMGYAVTVTDLRKAEALQESLADLADLDLTLHLGGHRESDFENTDLVVANPAVPLQSPFLERARSRGIPISSEIDLFRQAFPGKTILGVTGTNGKSTTTAMIARVLKQSGKYSRTWLGGNIGKSLLDEMDSMSSGDAVALELSSFQIERIPTASPWIQIAVFTRLAPDHLDRYAGMEEYAAAKKRLLAFQPQDGVAILPAEDPVVSAWASQCRGQVLTYGLKRGDIQLDGDWVMHHSRRLYPHSRIKIPGDHNKENALAATAAGLSLGISPRAIGDALESFLGLEHRLECLGQREGIRVYNNAVATTPEATLAALRALQAPVVLLAGGRGKNLDMAPLATEILSRVRLVGLYGDGAGELEKALDLFTGPPRQTHTSLAAALDWILPRLRSGDNLLFSPSFSSFDHYRNFRERGAEFRARLEEWLSGGSLTHSEQKASNPP